MKLLRSKYQRSLMLTAMLLGIASFVLGQDKGRPYYFEGNEVVFVFDIRNYARALEENYPGKADFEDLDIYKVAVSGDFNNWNKKGWKMVRKNDFLFELRKPIYAFNDNYPSEFRYIVNGKYIADAEGISPGEAKFSDDLLRDIYKLDLSVLEVNDEGNVIFALNERTDANDVVLTGSFNGWDEHSLKMQKRENGWRLRVNLPPGRYEYKFIIDGVWTHDKTSKESVRNEHGTLNSVLYVTTNVLFDLEGYPNAKEVILSGSFNNWNERQQRMFRVNDTWMTTMELPGGKHHYKFIVDGIWITDPANPLVEGDGMGNVNSVLFVH